MAYSVFHVDVFSFPILRLIMVLIIDLSLYFTHFVARAPDMLKLCARHMFFSSFKSKQRDRDLSDKGLQCSPAISWYKTSELVQIGGWHSTAKLVITKLIAKQCVCRLISNYFIYSAVRWVVFLFKTIQNI